MLCVSKICIALIAATSLLGLVSAYNNGIEAQQEIVSRRDSTDAASIQGSGGYLMQVAAPGFQRQVRQSSVSVDVSSDDEECSGKKESALNGASQFSQKVARGSAKSTIVRRRRVAAQPSLTRARSVKKIVHTAANGYTSLPSGRAKSTKIQRRRRVSTARQVPVSRKYAALPRSKVRAQRQQDARRIVQSVQASAKMETRAPLAAYRSYGNAGSRSVRTSSVRPSRKFQAMMRQQQTTSAASALQDCGKTSSISEEEKLAAQKNITWILPRVIENKEGQSAASKNSTVEIVEEVEEVPIVEEVVETAPVVEEVVETVPVVEEVVETAPVVEEVVAEDATPATSTVIEEQDVMSSGSDIPSNIVMRNVTTSTSSGLLGAAKLSKTRTRTRTTTSSSTLV